MVRFDSKTQAEIDTICDGGLDHYLAKKHKEFRRQRLEEGLIGSLVGVGIILGLSKIKDSGVKPWFSVFPATVGFLTGAIPAIFSVDDDDKQHEEDFDEFCEDSSEG